MKKLLGLLTSFSLLAIGFAFPATSSATSSTCVNKPRMYFWESGDTHGFIEYIFLDCPADTSVHLLNLGTANIGNNGGMLTLDPATNTIYATDWDNGVNKFSLDNSTAGASITTSGVALDNPWGIAIDPSAKRLYIASYMGGKVVTGPASTGVLSEIDLEAHGANTLTRPDDLRFDSKTNRLYISEDGTGATDQQIDWISTKTSNLGGQLNLGTAEADVINGLAIDHSANSNRIYWSNFNNTTTGSPVSRVDLTGGTNPISMAHIDGQTSQPQSLALNESTHSLYLSINNSIFRSVNDGGFPADALYTGQGWVVGLAILKSPAVKTRPAIAAKVKKGKRTFTCTPATWEGDHGWASTYLAPQTIKTDILQNGSVVARGKSTYISNKKGTYTCRTTATNAAGTTVSTSLSKKIK